MKIHITFLLLLGFIGVWEYQRAGMPAAITGVIFIILLFGCVLLHEFGHAIAAKAFGIKTPDITLLPIGGVARLERMPEKPYQELIVALAGPAVNVVIALGLLCIMIIRGDFVTMSKWQMPEIDIIMRLFVLNIILVIFNMVPAFPMDGGRVLRALLATQLNYSKATQIAARVGQGMSFVFLLLGLFWNPMLILIAVFIYFGAGQEARMAAVKEVSIGLPVASAMVTNFVTLRELDTLSDAVEALIRTSQHDFPVVNADGHVLGILSRSRMMDALKSNGTAGRILPIIEKDVPYLHPNSTFDSALRMLHQSGSSALPVIDAEGELVGLFTPENVNEMIMVNSALGKNVKPPWRRA